MGRSILAVVLGIVVAGLVVAGIEAVAHALNPPPPGLRGADAATLMAAMPTPALVNVVLAWALGSIAGGFVAAKVSRAHPRGAALAVGLGMVALIAVNLLMLPHPAWMMACGLLLPVPLALGVGRKLAVMRPRR